MLTLNKKKRSQFPSILNTSDLHSESVLLFLAGLDMIPTASFLVLCIVVNRLVPNRHIRDQYCKSGRLSLLGCKRNRQLVAQGVV